MTQVSRGGRSSVPEKRIEIRVEVNGIAVTIRGPVTSSEQLVDSALRITKLLQEQPEEPDATA